jgi:uncharacterized alpha-E superfamily protein
MLGRTAGGIYWMFRHLERSENTARLIEAGLRIALTRSADAAEEWESVVTTAGQRQRFLDNHDKFTQSTAVDFLLRDRTNPASVSSVIESARNNAREVRTALTREVWEATNTCWLQLSDALERPIATRDLPEVLGLIRQESAYVRGALHGTMMRNDVYDFARLGTFLERADNTARILDVKYYVLLPSVMHVGSWLDNVQWETILRSVSAQRAYRWSKPGQMTPMGIADFLILDLRMPRSLAFCYTEIEANLEYLADDYGVRHPCHDQARELVELVERRSIDSIFDEGLHEFLDRCIAATNRVGSQIELDYRFNE